MGGALLARNLLLGRSPLGVVPAVERVVGLQAQEPQEPYIGPFSRLLDFDPRAASEALEGRALVRTLMMRRTIHLMSSEDCLALRSLHQPMIEQRTRAVLRRRLNGVDEADLAAAGLPWFTPQPRTLPEVGRLVGEQWPHVAARDLGDALSSLIPLVQVPPGGLWRQRGPARNTTVEAWLGKSPTEPAPHPDSLILRYLAAFGPAAAADIRSWSGLGRLGPAVQRLMPRLRTFHDDRGRLLLDVPDCLLPHEETSAPARFPPLSTTPFSATRIALASSTMPMDASR